MAPKNLPPILIMDIPVNINSFSSKRIFLKPRGLFSFAPKILLNGQPVPRTGYGYLIPDDAGNNVEFRVCHRFYDPIPDLMVANKRIVLVPALKLYEHVWICLPFFILLLYGGLLGGVCGVFALNANYLVFRGAYSQLNKFILSGLITLGAWLLYFAIIIVLVRGFGMGKRM